MRNFATNYNYPGKASFSKGLQHYLARKFLASPNMKLTTKNGLVQVYFAIPDFDIVAAIRISADPGFVLNWCTLTTEVG